MLVDLSQLIPLATIIGASVAPVVSIVWVGHQANRNAMRAAELAAIAAKKVSEVKEVLQESTIGVNTKLDTIHVLVNSQLSEAVERLKTATAEIEALKKLLEISMKTNLDQKVV